MTLQELLKTEGILGLKILAAKSGCSCAYLRFVAYGYTASNSKKWRLSKKMIDQITLADFRFTAEELMAEREECWHEEEQK